MTPPNKFLHYGTTPRTSTPYNVEQVALEKERLQIEKERLELERRRMDMEKKRYGLIIHIKEQRFTSFQLLEISYIPFALFNVISK